MNKPIRIQRKRTRGWKMPENTISVTRPGEFGNPFKVGGYFKIGDGKPYGMIWSQSYLPDPSFTLVKTNEHAVEMYIEFRKRYPLVKTQIDKIKGKNLACWCKIGAPCHADMLLKIANE